MKLPDIYNILQKYDACKTLDQVSHLTVDSISSFGASYYFAGEMPPENLDSHNNRAYVIGGHWVDRWTERYFLQDYIRRDPAIKHVRTQDTPFIWSHLQHNDLDGQRIMYEASCVGLHNGITIAQQGLNNKRIGISFAGEKLDMDNPFLSTGLTVIAAYAVDAHLRIGQRNEILKDVTLTPREHEVLKWIADGVTSIETGEIIGISTPTVEKHFRTALTKLGANNRTHAIAIAIRLGLLN
ncbi:helix-turn-helix transcriptional regulator [Lentilitoribacter sp. EG35]|uniref:helix-turn-helix transcriptional regulator n=1 Tax=Lentilitoribacter sp. EG35 TaxID=3234192 RepID=UPI00345FB80E